MKTILTKHVADALRALTREQVDALVAGKSVAEVTDPHAFFADVAQPLMLSYAGASIAGPLAPEGGAKLAKYHADPDQPVAVRRDGLPEVQECAIDGGNIVETIDFYDLPAEAKGMHHAFGEYPNIHAHGRFVLLRNRLGEEKIIWRDGDPTKGGAWDVEIDATDDPRVRALFD